MTGFREIADCRAWVIEELKKTASTSVLIRSGIAIIIRMIQRMGDEPASRPFCQ